ncbi:unnamed protein product [Cunninghamella echinulata]
MTTSTKGPAFEIRFCEGNKVQVYDLSKKGQHVLPSEYQEDDVAKGRLRYSKLGNQPIIIKQRQNENDSNNDDDDNNYKSINTTPTTTTTATSPNNNNENIGLNVIPVVAKQKALEDEKELESIRQAEEAVRKAMERKQKIERARIARQKALIEAEGQQQQQPNDIMNDDNNHNYNMEINRKEEDIHQLSPQPSYQSVKKINKEHTIITDMNIKEKSDNTMTIHQPSTPVPQQQQQQQHYYQQYNNNNNNSNNNKYKHHDQHLSSSSLSSSITPLPTSLPSPPQPAATYYNKASYPNINHHHQQQQQQQNYSYQPNINNNSNINNNYNNMNMTIPPKVQNEEYPSFFHQDMDDHKKKNSSCCCIIS